MHRLEFKLNVSYFFLLFSVSTSVTIRALFSHLSIVRETLITNFLIPNISSSKTWFDFSFFRCLYSFGAKEQNIKFKVCMYSYFYLVVIFFEFFTLMFFSKTRFWLFRQNLSKKYDLFFWTSFFNVQITFCGCPLAVVILITRDVFLSRNIKIQKDL